MIQPILLCGGAGTRLWPLSRKSYPKQFARLVGSETLFQAAATRMAGPGIAAPLVVTAADFRFIVAEQLAEIGIDPGAILIEPEPRNTAAAVLAAALHLAGDPDSLMLVMPADHVIPDNRAFRAAVASGIPAAQAGAIVTFGIHPTRAETGYGWLELDGASDHGTPSPLRRFVEKPGRDLAEGMLASGRHLWNSGIFLMSVRTILAAFDAHAPGLVPPVRAAVDRAQIDLGFVRLAAGPWGDIEAVSIDVAVMERAANLVVVPFAAEWSDLGDWASVWRANGSDGDGLCVDGAVAAIDCADSLLRSEPGGPQLVGIGLRDLVVIAMTDAVLVADRNRVQDVKHAVADLKAMGVRQAEAFPRDHRPWGWFETLVQADRFQVKRIVVHPAAALSLQSHLHRAEHWVVVSGTAQVTVDGDVQLLSENQSIYVPLGTIHRMANPGKVPLVVIEVQTGTYLGEDDIIRYDDIYARFGTANP